MIIKDWTLNGTRYMIEGLITKTNRNGEKYHPDEAYGDGPFEPDEYRVECNTLDPTKDADGHYICDNYGEGWDEVGEWYYDSIHDAIAAAAQHAKETTA
jgi:hypothetical protein